MENFFILEREEIVCGQSFIYDNGAKLHNKTILFNSESIEIPFSPVYFKNLTFDFLLLSEDQTLYRINKFKKILESIGTITDRILAISCGNDKIVILTDKEILLFNSYFDLEAHIDLLKVYEASIAEEFDTLNSKYKIVFGDDIFVIITPVSAIILSFDLSINGIYKDSILDAVFISKYNKFACISTHEHCIKFIEPNGLEHGEPLNDFCENLKSLFIGDTQLILLDKKDHVVGYYQKNFFWYKKFTLKGKLYSTEDNSIIVKDDNSLFQYFLFKEKAINFVINGSILYYTNFNRAIIPPPFYYKAINFESEIFCFCFFRSTLACADQCGISLFSIDGKDQIIKTQFISYKELGLDVEHVFEVLLTSQSIYLRVIKGIYKIDIASHSIEKMNASQNVLRMFYSDEKLMFLLDSGDFTVENMLYHFNFSKKENFDVQIKNDEIFLLNSGNLQTIKLENLSNLTKSTASLSLNSEQPNNSKPITSFNSNINQAIELYTDVSSFLLHDNYLLYIIKDEFIVLDRISNEKTCSYAEEHMEILTVKDNTIIFSTRFGSLETVTNKLFSIAIIKKLIESNSIYEAAVKCDLNHVDFSIFIGNSGFPAELIPQFTDSQALSFFNSLKIPKHEFLLENEIVERLDLNFDEKFVTRDIPFKINISSCIPNEISKRFLIDLNVDSEINFNLKNAEFLKNPIKIPKLITQESTMENINAFLNFLTIEKHFSTIVNVFIALNRVDLCFYLPNIQKVVKILLTKLCPENICKASIYTFDVEKIILTHKLCQRDYASFISFFTSCENQKFSIYRYLENPKLSLYHLVNHHLKNNLPIDEILQYSVSNNVINCLMMFTYHNVFNFSFYSYIAKYKEPLDGFYLFKNDGNTSKAMELAIDNLYWREALDLNSSDENCILFVKLLAAKSRYVEAGEIFEKFFNDYTLSVELYLKGRAILRALELYRTKEFSKGINYDKLANGLCDVVALKSFEHKLSKEDIRSMILESCLKYSKNDIATINALIETFVKYKNRLQHVRTRLNENMNASQTTFTYSSIRSTQKALIKDRPGGIYENEFVMNKISKTVAEICELRCQVEEILKVFEEFDEIESKNLLLKAFEPLKNTLRSDVDDIWNYQRTDVDINLPIVLKPLINEYF